MSKLTRNNVNALLRKQGRFLYLTQGGEPCYQIEGERGTLPRRLADELTGNLFATMAIQRKGEAALIPQEDGLFPGFSQTWRAEQ